MNRFINHFCALLVLLFSGCGELLGETFSENKEDKSILVETYQYSSEIESSKLYKVTANKESQFVYPTLESHICSFGCNGSISIRIDCAASISDYVVRPISKNYNTFFEGNSIFLTLAPYDKACVEINGDELHPLFIFANPISLNKPKNGDADILFYKAGKVYNINDRIDIKDNQTVYIEGGAIVHACFQANNAENFNFDGFGIIDMYKFERKFSGGIDIRGCKNYCLNNFIILGIPGRLVWSCESHNFKYDNVKAIGYQNSGQDIFDLYGCYDVGIKRCFAHGNDDTYCIKSQKFNFKGECYNIRFKDCIAWNTRGNSFEIGYETNLDVYDVSYENIIAIHSSHNLAENEKPFRRGAVSIHCGAGGTIRNICYDNVFIEDPKEGAIDIRIIKSQYNIGNDIIWAPGQIKNVEMKNVHILKAAPQGSSILGYNDTHKPEIKFVNLEYLGKKVLNPNEAQIMNKFSDIRFE